MVYDDNPPEPLGAIDDDRLRLIYTCCHPALAIQTRVALTLHMLGGLTVPEIARAFLVQETAMGQVLALYDQLVPLDPSPIITLNRDTAVAELDGPELALAAIDRLEQRLATHHVYHATRADLLRRLGHSQQSRAAYDSRGDGSGWRSRQCCRPGRQLLTVDTALSSALQDVV